MQPPPLNRDGRKLLKDAYLGYRKSFGYKIRNKAPLNAFTSESEFVRGHNKKVLLSFFPRKKDHSKGIKLLRRKKKQRREARSLIATCLVVLWSYVVVDENVWWS